MIVKIDATKFARKWQSFRNVTTGAFFVAISQIASLIFSITSYKGRFSIIILIAVAALYVVCVTWKYQATPTEFAIRRLRLMFLLLLSCAVVYALLYFSILQSGTSDELEIIMLPALASLLLGIMGSYMATTLLGRTLDVDGLHLTFRELLGKAPPPATGPAPKEAYWLIRIDQPLGLLWFVIGIAALLLGAGEYGRPTLLQLAGHGVF